MNKEIFIDDNRILKLKNVLIYTINCTNLNKDNSLDKIIYNFNNYIKNHGLIKSGPFIIQTTLMEGDEPTLLIKLLQQIKSFNHKPIAPYEMVEEFISKRCIYARFEGYEKDLNIAQSKIQVYAYENDIILDSTSYLVYVKNDKDGNCVVDNFVVVLGRNS